VSTLEFIVTVANGHRKRHLSSLEDFALAITLDYEIPPAVGGEFEALGRNGDDLRARARLPNPQFGISVSENGARDFPGRAKRQQRLFNLQHKRSIRRAGKAQGVHLVTSPSQQQQKKAGQQ
jgi:hypothetical protein